MSGIVRARRTHAGHRQTADAYNIVFNIRSASRCSHRRGEQRLEQTRDPGRQVSAATIRDARIWPSVVVVTDNDPELAKREPSLSAMLWATRDASNSTCLTRQRRCDRRQQRQISGGAD